MKASARLYVLSVLALLWSAAGAYAEAGLVVVEPSLKPATAQYTLHVDGDGFARFHLKWDGQDSGRANFFVSTFTPKNGSTAVAVGLAPSTGQVPEPLLPSLSDVEVTANGTTILLGGAALEPGKEYTGTLYATIGSQTLPLGITLTQPEAVAPFRCPADTQTLGPDGTASFELQNTLPLRQKTIGLRLSPFLATDNTTLGSAGFARDPVSHDLQPDLANFAFADHPVSILTSGFTEGTIYKGKMRIIIDGRDAMTCSLDMLMPKLPKGELVTEGAALIRTVTLSFLGRQSPVHPLLAIPLFDKDRSHRIDGITATLDGATQSPHGAFDLARHVTFGLGGTEIANFTQWPDLDAKTRPLRTLQPGGQLNLEMTFKDLDPGKYVFPLRFTAANAASTPKLEITLNVRDHWGWAVIAVALALLVSWFITTGIVNWKARNDVRLSAQGMREENFESHADLPSVVFLNAVLAQAEGAARSWLRPPPPSVAEYLSRAKRVVSIMSRYRTLIGKVDKASCTSTVKARYRENIAEAMRRIGPYPLDQSTADSILAELDAISTRLDTPMVWYQAYLLSQAAALYEQAKAVQAKLGTPQTDVDHQILLLKTPAADLDDADKRRNFECAYWFVRLLYWRRDFPKENDQLIAAFKQRGLLEDVFDCGDKFAWKRLEDAAADEAVKIGPAESTTSTDSSAGSATLESLRPTTFVLKFDDRTLEESYLITNVLSYEWEFEFKEAKTQRTVHWSRVLKGTRAAYYAPGPGELTVKVTIQRPSVGGAKAEQIGPIERVFTIEKNQQLSLIAHMTLPDIWLTLGVGVIALVTSLSVLYFDKETFGSMTDYLKILTWAIGIDQGKNLIQLLKSYQTAGSSTVP